MEFITQQRGNGTTVHIDEKIERYLNETGQDGMFHAFVSFPNIHLYPFIAHFLPTKFHYFLGIFVPVLEIMMKTRATASFVYRPIDRKTNTVKSSSFDYLYDNLEEVGLKIEILPLSMKPQICHEVRIGIDYSNRIARDGALREEEYFFLILSIKMTHV